MHYKPMTRRGFQGLINKFGTKLIYLVAKEGMETLGREMK